MNHVTSPCDDERLRLLLYGEEQSAEFQSAMAHLQDCSACQSRFDELAADKNEWADVKQLRARDEIDRLIDSEQCDRTWSRSGHRHAPDTWTEAMTSQLLSPPSHPEMLGRIGRYEVERMIGSGGMGVVFKAFDAELNRPVAIKLLAPHLAGSGAARQRFSREARAAAAIVHEHVVAIHNVESDAEPPYLVMQYVPGESLQGRLDREGPLSMCEVLRIARQTAIGLAAAHEQGLVHRDVKPSNILLEEGVDRALLTDFGLARASDDASLTHSGYVPGTPHYMSPEQARGESADQKSDLFSLGSVMYTMCTGRSPFRAETSYGVLRRITDAQPRSIREVNPDIPLWLCCLIEKLLAKTTSDRFDSAFEVADLLGRCLAHVQQPDTQPLPETAARLVQQAQPRQIASFLQTGGSYTLATALVSVAALLVVIVGSVMIALSRSDDATALDQSDVASIERHDNTQTPLEAESNLDPALNWDSIESQVQSLSTQIDELSSRHDLLWDSMPTSDRPQIELGSAQPSHQTAKESMQ